MILAAFQQQHGQCLERLVFITLSVGRLCCPVKSNKINYAVALLLCKIHTPSPWLTRIRFARISLTRIFKKFSFLTQHVL